MVAIVTNTDDPNDWGRVKVKYPWVSDEEESHWARVVSIGAGPDCGLAVIPAVEDEVMVIFEHGDFNRPGGAGRRLEWPGRSAQTVLDAPQGEKPLVRSWQSRTGHQITVYDNSDNKIDIATSGGHLVSLSDAEKKITIKSSGGLELTMEDNGKKITVSSDGNIELAGGDIDLKGTNITVDASGNLALQASGQVTVKGSMINLNELQFVGQHEDRGVGDGPTSLFGGSAKCAFGTSPGSLTVLPAAQVATGNMPDASIMDHQPMANVSSFGMCITLSNPQVAAATSAALGVLTPQPCIPVTAQPWTPGSPTVQIGGNPALTNACTLLCQWGGLITVQQAGQMSVNTV